MTMDSIEGQEVMLIYLTGFMCAGKTTSGNAVARRLDIPFLDLDEELEKRSGRSVSDFIDTLGIVEFRRLESIILLETHQFMHKELVLSPQHTRRAEAIIATGGGSVLSPENRALLTDTEHAVCWLHPPFPVLLARLKSHPRPLLMDLSTEDIYGIYLERLPYYQSTATHIITEVDSVSELIMLFGPGI